MQVTIGLRGKAEFFTYGPEQVALPPAPLSPLCTPSLVASCLFFTSGQGELNLMQKSIWIVCMNARA